MVVRGVQDGSSAARPSQPLMRHSTSKLTADLYGELGIDDVGEDVWNLPTLFPSSEGEPSQGLPAAS